MTNSFLMYHHICIKVFCPNQLLYLTDLMLARQFIDTSPPAKVTHIHKISQNNLHIGQFLLSVKVGKKII
jgi:hypothetical protein